MIGKRPKFSSLLHTGRIFKTVYVESRPEKKLCRFASEASKSEKIHINYVVQSKNLNKNLYIYLYLHKIYLKLAKQDQKKFCSLRSQLIT